LKCAGHAGHQEKYFQASFLIQSDRVAIPVRAKKNDRALRRRFGVAPLAPPISTLPRFEDRKKRREKNDRFFKSLL
jgi:hypothetical protein